MGEILKKATKGNVSFWICLGVSIFLILGGCIYPPPFFIESSIFIATGELFAFASLGAFLKALDRGVDAHVRHNDTEIHILNESDEEKNKELSEEYDT